MKQPAAFPLLVATAAMLMGLLVTPNAIAAVQFEAEKKLSYEEQQAAGFAKVSEQILGKTFWFEPNPKIVKFSQLAFAESRPSPEKSAYDNHNAPTFRPTGKVPFRVTDVFALKYSKEAWRSPDYFAEVTFEGGKVGYLKFRFSGEPPFKVYDASRAYMAAGDEVVYLEDPDVIREREREAKAAEEQKVRAAQKAWEARGGVRIGMSKKQVLASNWGEPERINTTRNSRGTLEQWVYGDGNYLYFTNGVLTTIQN